MTDLAALPPVGAAVPAPAAPAAPAPAAVAPVAQVVAPPVQTAPVVAPVAAAAAPAIPPALAAMLAPVAPAVPAAAPIAPVAAAPVVAPAPVVPAAEPSKPSAEDQVSALRGQLNAKTIREHVVGIASEVGAINPDQILKLLGDDLDVAPDGRVMVKGDPKADPKQHVAQYLRVNLHLLKPVVPGGGAGSPSSVQAPGAAPPAPAPYTAEGGTAIARGFMGRMFPAPAAPPAGAPPR